jgi:hypothetical protein
VRCEHRFALGVGELLISDPEHVHLDARGHERHFRLLVLRDGGRRVQRDGVPDDLDGFLRNTIAAEKISGRVGTVNLESKLRMAISLGQTDVVKMAPAYKKPLGRVLIRRALAECPLLGLSGRGR